MLGFIMSVHRNIFKIAALWAVVALAQAQEPAQTQATDPAASSVPAQPTPAPTPVPASESHWRLAAALGYGMRSNPLIQSDDIPVIVDLDVAWFGKRWFFDNGDVGLTFSEGARSTTSLVARLNSDRVFFGKTDTRFVNFAYAGGGATTPLVGTDTGALVAEQPVEVRIPDRNYAIEVGVESLIDGDWGVATLRAFHDVSGTHGGYELSAYYSRRWIAGRLSFTPTVGVAYKSARLNDYYWGVHADEASPALPEYRADDGFGFEGGLVANYHLSRNLRIALSVNYERLADEVAASPLAEDEYVFAYFSGLAWTF
jgi:outer membrane protein